MRPQFYHASASLPLSLSFSPSGLLFTLSSAILRRWRALFAATGRHCMIALVAFFRPRMLCCMSTFATLLGSIIRLWLSF